MYGDIEKYKTNYMKIFITLQYIINNRCQKLLLKGANRTKSLKKGN